MYQMFELVSQGINILFYSGHCSIISGQLSDNEQLTISIIY